MIEWDALGLFALLGLFGSVHCIGMCGPFAIGLAVATRGSFARKTLGSLAYAGGKATSYAVLGVAAAEGAAWLARGGAALAGADETAHAIELARRGLAWVAGLSIVVFALGHLGWRPAWLRGVRVPVPPFAARLFALARSLSGAPASFATGFLNGFLPCGLSWSALALAAGTDSAHAALGMFAFGLATAPALCAVALSGALAPSTWRARAAKLAAPVLLAFGILTLARGGFVPPGRADLLPECCREPDRAQLEARAADR